MTIRLIIVILAASIGISCRGEENTAVAFDDAVPVGEAIEIDPPNGLPPLPGDARLTSDLIALGRRLFNEKRLSSDGTVSCASCHNPDLYFTDGLKVAKGVGGQLGSRNSPTVLNAVFNTSQFWDGRAASLEDQAGIPIAAPNEMNMPHESCVERLSSDQSYRDQFEKVYGSGPITMGRVLRAIAAFERTLLSGNSPFDRHQYGGDKSALSEEAIRGMQIFRGKGNCATCHTIGESYALFTDGQFHNVGAGMNSSGELADQGRFEQTRVESDRGAFRTPSLRNVAKTAPYMHDGSLKTLEEVVAFYIGGGNSNPQLDPEIRPIGLSARDRTDLIAFLESLTGDLPQEVASSRGKK
ncbi:MAG: cytochrome-c peroxidase [Acidobacteriota bacterium]|nr:MAG: cytochrome-c peroxidase [Acidobacteriota bacterium]